ncbi:MAG: hypothetical protein Q8O04_06045 [Deltaproteobacteria bacterium]|nr:hypothetical protein [Deltaproteobacteria bacterium]
MKENALGLHYTSVSEAAGGRKLEANGKVIFQDLIHAVSQKHLFLEYLSLENGRLAWSDPKRGRPEFIRKGLKR